MLRGRHVDVVVVVVVVGCIDYHQRGDFQAVVPVHAHRRYVDSLEFEQRLALRIAVSLLMELMCILKDAFARVERPKNTRESRSNCN
jgi:hypothetical protein